MPHRRSPVYVGGSFFTIGGQARNYLAAVDAETGLANAWNPSPHLDVRAICVDGSTVYVSGYFSSIGGQSRNFLAALSATTGMATSWHAAMPGFPGRRGVGRGEERVDRLGV